MPFIRSLEGDANRENRRPLNKEELRGKKTVRADFRKLARNPIYVVMDSLKCAHNIGTIFRLCDSLLVTKVFLCGNTILPPNGKIKQASRGAERWVDWQYLETVDEALFLLKQQGVQLFAAEVAENSIPFTAMKIAGPCALVLGREFDGVSKAALSQVDHVVHLPIQGMANSINVSAAASVLLYEIHRQIVKG